MGMRPRSPEVKLREIQDKIEELYLRQKDDFNLPARYQALVKLEALMLETVKAPNKRRDRELAVLR